MPTKTRPAVEVHRDLIVDAVLTASRVLVAVAARSLGDVADEVTMTQYRTLVVLASRGPQSSRDTGRSGGRHATDRDPNVRSPGREGPGRASPRPSDRRLIRLTLAKKGGIWWLT